MIHWPKCMRSNPHFLQRMPEAGTQVGSGRTDPLRILATSDPSLTALDPTYEITRVGRFKPRSGKTDIKLFAHLRLSRPLRTTAFPESLGWVERGETHQSRVPSP